MLGKASEIKTKRVDSYFKKGITIDQAINETLKNLVDPESDPIIISIQYRAACTEDMEDSALIIYKEGESA